MAANLNNFEVAFLDHGTESLLIVRADDLDQALKAARIKLAMRNMGNCDIVSLRRQGAAHSPVFERDVDLSDSFAVLLQVAMAMQEDLSLTLNGKTPVSVAFFLAAKCLQDHGYERPEAMAAEALRLEEYTSIRRCIGYGDDRPILDPIRCMDDIACELLEKWIPNGSRKLTWEEKDALLHGDDIYVDYDEGVDFAQNTIAYAYLLLVGAGKVVDGGDDTQVYYAERIVDRFMAANPTASPAIYAIFSDDAPSPHADVVARSM